ncbi:MAG: MFS transporter [Candidatus Paceibacterota bacterium]|jgi:MFS family permease
MSEQNNLTLDQKYARTRKLSIKEGMAASITGGAGESYITPFALELKASNFQISLLSGLASLIGPIAQLGGSRLIEKFSRRSIVVTSVILHASVWFIFASLGGWFYFYGQSYLLIPLLILAYIIYALAGSLGGPAWFSLLGDAVPENIRGAYFSNRNKINIAVNISATLLASLLLFYAKENQWLILAFISLFIIAGIARYFSAFFLSKHHEEKMSLPENYFFSLWQFIRKAPSNNFGRFAIYVAAINLAMNISGPFFAIYMWRDLALNPIWYTIISISGSLFTLLFMPMWGKFADRYGNRELLKIGSLIIIPASVLWLFSANPFYLIFVPQLVTGVGWAAFSLAASNFIYDSVTPERRAICVAYQNVLSGLGVFLGAGLGGLIVKYIDFKSFNILFLAFILSAIVRSVFVSLILPSIKEVLSDKYPTKENPLLYFKELAIGETISSHLYPLGEILGLKKGKEEQNKF